MIDHIMNISRNVNGDHCMCDAVMVVIISEPDIDDGAPIPINVMSPAAICLAMTTR